MHVTDEENHYGRQNLIYVDNLFCLDHQNPSESSVNIVFLGTKNLVHNKHEELFCNCLSDDVISSQLWHVYAAVVR